MAVVSAELVPDTFKFEITSNTSITCAVTTKISKPEIQKFKNPQHERVDLSARKY
jgi:hypothetical protein